MFERFTDRARRVTALAQEEARTLRHNYIGTEHLLLGMLREADGIAAQALAGFGLDLEKARTAVLEIIGEGQSAPAGHIPFTPRAKKVCELAHRESLLLGHNYIGTEHLLLGLIREGGGVGGKILVEAGADLASAREAVLALITPAADPKPDPQSVWLKKVTQTAVYVVNCSYCKELVTGGTGYPNPIEAADAAQAAGAILTNLGGLWFNGPPVACVDCQKRPLSEFRQEPA